MDHSFDVEHAKKYGVDTAIVLKNLQFWIMKNKANNRHFYEGRTWTYNSVKAFAELFPYWTERQIIRILKTMEEKKIIISGNYNKSAYDRTKWYAFFDESIYLKSEIHLTERSNGNTEKVKPIPNNKPDENNTDDKQHIQVLGFEQKKNLKEDKFKKNSIVSQAKRPNTPCIENILSHLNKKTGSNYQTRNQTVKKLIEKHIKAGYTEEDFLIVIEKKCLEWGKDEKMKKYIRPVTLFGSKFEQYLEEPWADGRINEKYDPEKHIKFPRWDALPPDVQYRWNDEEYYTSGRTEYVQGKGKKIFWTDDYDDLVKWEDERREQSRRYHAEVERKQREYIANGGSEYDDEYPL